MEKKSLNLGIQTQARDSLEELSNPFLPTPPPNPRRSPCGFSLSKNSLRQDPEKGSSCCLGISSPQAEQAISPGYLTLASPHPRLLTTDTPLEGPPLCSQP